MPSDEALMGQRVFDQAMDMWIRPEIERRQRRGVLSLDFKLDAAQVIFPSPLDRKGTYIRLNEEVTALLSLRAHRPIRQGEQVSVTDVEDIDDVRLPPDEDPNAAHLTMLKVRGNWLISFDFTYNRERARQHLAAATEFLAASELSGRNKLWRPAADTLFSAVELAAEAELLLVPRKLTKKHQERAKRFKQWVQLGNAPATTDSALYRLAALRSKARYLEASFDPSIEKLGQYHKPAEELIAHVEERLKKTR